MKNRIIMYFCIFLLILPMVCHGQLQKDSVPRVSFDFIDADIRNVLRILTEVSKKNIIVTDDVKGKVTMKLDNVPWNEAFDIIIRANTSPELEKIEEDNIIRVITLKRAEDERRKSQTDREALRKERIEKQRMGEELVTETVYLSYANPGDMEKMLRGDGGGSGAAGAQKRGFLSEFGSITQVAWNNALIIKDTKESISNIAKVVKEHDVKPTQVQIDCRIVQATSDFSREIGIQWGATYSQTSRALGNKEFELTGGRNVGSTSSDTGYTATTEMVGLGLGGRDNFPYAVNLPAAVAAGSGGSLGIFIGSAADSTLIDAQLTALESEGKGKVISSPKIITSNNKKAVISQGKSIPYQTVSMSGTQTEFAEAVLGLEVTPSVTKDGFIKLEIMAKKDSADFINTSQGVPTIDKKEATTLLYVRDGETAVIGGIYETISSDGESGVPFLKDIPLLGLLFKKKSARDNKTELLIFITPRILKNLYHEEG